MQQSQMVLRAHEQELLTSQVHAKQTTTDFDTNHSGHKEGIATYSSVLAWRIPCTEESGRLQSIGVPRVRQD